MAVSITNHIIRAKTDTLEETLKKIILRTGYDVASISKIESDVESAIKIFP